MALSITWSEATPADSEALAQGDDRIREHKIQMRETWQIDHEFPSSGSAGDATLGYHKAAHLKEQADPTAVTDVGIVYAKDVGGTTELFYRDSAGNVIQITNVGKIRAASIEDGTVTKTGDLILSTVATARTGWTDATATYNAKFFRVGAGLAAGERAGRGP